VINRAAARRGDGKTARRDRAILALLFDLGLRRGELCGLDLADVERNQESKPAAVWIKGKGHQEKQRLTVPAATGRILADWLEIRRAWAGALFHRLDGHLTTSSRLSGTAVYLIVRQLGRAARVLRPVRPHGLRHSAATTAPDYGRDVRDVQRFTRHKSLDMVLRYDDQLRDTAGEIADLLSRRRDAD
jgi:site-specific recombinase XerC